MISLERPEYLWLLLAVIPVVGLALVSRRHLSRRRMLLATGIRIAMILVLTLALAGLTRKTPADAVAVVYVVDRSASVGGPGVQAAIDFANASLEHRDKDDLAGIVVFGAEPLVESEARPDLEVHSLESTPSPHQTDIASAIRLGTALLPSDRTGRVVVLSDFEETRGDAATEALLTASDAVSVSSVAVGSERGSDALLDDLLAPASVDEDAAYTVRVVGRSETATTGKLRLYRNEEYLGEMPVALSGEHADVFTFRQEAREPGLYRYRAVLQVDDPGADSLPQNNEVVTTVQVAGRPSVLYVEGYPEQRRHLAEVLQNQGIQVDFAPVGDIPPGLSELRPYSAVIFSDVPAYTLTRRQQEAIRSYVRDLGRGFVMIGGDQSFGLGGYYNTPIEDALPVDMDIKDKTRFPKLAMVFALDKSCSMGGGAGSKLDLAKEAGIQTAELLSDRDLLGVIGFDSAADWIVDLEPLGGGRRTEVIDTISSIRTGGGTDIYPAASAGIQALDASDAALKHVILISDGMTTDGAYEQLFTGAHARGITITSVAIGEDADRHTMQQFATWGGGNYYLVTDVNAIPAIFTRETLLATRSFLIEKPFQPHDGAPSDIMEGLRARDIPTLEGYVATEPKDRAVVALTAPHEDSELPLLAHWNYGLGRSVAFTSDSKPRWSQRWVGTESYTRFWSQTVRWAIGESDLSNLVVETEISEGELRVTVDAFDDGGGFLNFLEGEARVIAPDLSVRRLDLRQVAPGRYEAVTTVDQDGSWLVGASLSRDGEVVGQAVSEAVQPYSPEYRSSGAGPALRDEVARVGRGSVLDDPAAVFARPETPRQIPRPVWPWLMLLATLGLVLDVASRRLDLRRSRGTLVQVTAPAKPPPTAWKPAAQQAPPIRPEVAEPEPAAVEPEQAPSAPPDSYAGRLLAARREARKKMGEDEE